MRQIGVGTGQRGWEAKLGKLCVCVELHVSYCLLTAVPWQDVSLSNLSTKHLSANKSWFYGRCLNKC